MMPPFSSALVEHLFQELFTNALELRFPDEINSKRLWKNQLDQKYFCFSGEPVRYEEAYNEADQSPFIRILMSPPEVTATVCSPILRFSPQTPVRLTNRSFLFVPARFLQRRRILETLVGKLILHSSCRVFVDQASRSVCQSQV